MSKGITRHNQRYLFTVSRPSFNDSVDIIKLRFNHSLLGGKTKDLGNEVEFVNGNDFQILYSDELMFNYDALSAVPIQNYIHKNDFTIFALSSH